MRWWSIAFTTKNNYQIHKQVFLIVRKFAIEHLPETHFNTFVFFLLFSMTHKRCDTNPRGSCIFSKIYEKPTWFGALLRKPTCVLTEKKTCRRTRNTQWSDHETFDNMNEKEIKLSYHVLLQVLFNLTLLPLVSWYASINLLITVLLSNAFWILI